MGSTIFIYLTADICTGWPGLGWAWAGPGVRRGGINLKQLHEHEFSDYVQGKQRLAPQLNPVQSLTQPNIGFIMLDLNCKMMRFPPRGSAPQAAAARRHTEISILASCFRRQIANNDFFCVCKCRSVPESAADMRELQRGGVPALLLRLKEERTRHHGHQHPSLQAAGVHGGRRAGGDC